MPTPPQNRWQSWPWFSQLMKVKLLQSGAGLAARADCGCKPIAMTSTSAARIIRFIGAGRIMAARPQTGLTDTVNAFVMPDSGLRIVRCEARGLSLTLLASWAYLAIIYPQAPRARAPYGGGPAMGYNLE